MKYKVKTRFESFEFKSGMTALDFATAAARSSTDIKHCTIEVSAEDEDKDARDTDDH